MTLPKIFTLEAPFDSVEAQKKLESMQSDNTIKGDLEIDLKSSPSKVSSHKNKIIAVLLMAVVLLTGSLVIVSIKLATTSNTLASLQRNETELFKILMQTTNEEVTPVMTHENCIRLQ